MFHPFAHVPTWKQLEKALAEGRIEMAESHLQAHLRAYPQDSEAWILQGYLEARADCLEQAEQSYRQALLLQPQYPEAWFNLALIQLRLKQEPAAIESLHNVLQWAPEHP